MIVESNRIVDAAEVLSVAGHVQAAVEAALTPEEYAALVQSSGETTTLPLVYSAEEKEQALEDFALISAAESLEVLAGQVRALAEQKTEEVYRMALDVYYEIEKLSRDPEHAHLIEHVEKMRSAHEASYGRAIPAR